jgi:anaerobic selenocysteine-containing dehydrogenase/ferredoxin-NADP reductase
MRRPRRWRREAGMTEISTPGFCALCKSRCGSVMVTENGRFLRQEPNPTHPTGQALCIKGKAAAEIIYRPSRQLYPLRRTRPKGDPDPGWMRISWDEALARTAEALEAQRQAHGAESVAFGWTTPSGTPFSDDLRWVERFTNAFGSPNVAYGTEICNWHKDYAHAYTFGRSIGAPDFAHAGCVVLWGHNPSATWLDHATATGAAVARGAKLIVVDPRRAGFAGRADQWLRVRPGADGALALGIANEMIRHGWFNEDFVQRWTNGPLLVREDNGRFLRAGDLAAPPAGAAAEDLIAWDGEAFTAYSTSSRQYSAQRLPVLRGEHAVVLADGVPIACKTGFTRYAELCASYPPSRVEEVCWVPADQVTDTARLLHQSGPISYYAWSGIGQHTNATQTDRALAILMALTGSIDAPGGNVEFGRPPANDVSAADLLTPAQRAKCIELDRSPLGPGRHGWIGSDALYRAVLEGEPYPVRTLMNFGRNFLVNHANAARGAQALQKLEFFVHADVVLNPTAAYADIFLPINTPWERQALRVGFEGSAAAEQLVQLRQAAIAPEGESRSDGYVVFELAKRLGMGHLFWDGDIDAGLEHVLQPSGLTLEMLRAQPQGIAYPAPTHYRQYETRGFKTATGKIEIYSEVFQDGGEAPLPAFVEPAASPMRGPQATFPLVLTSAKIVQFCHGQHRDIPSLRKRAPHPEVNLHPDAAGERGIQDGDDIELLTPGGKVRMRAKFDRTLDPRVACAQYGWWQGNAALQLPATDPLTASGASLNLVVSDAQTDPISGSVGLRSSMCELRAIGPTRAWTGWRRFRVAGTRKESHDIVSVLLEPVDGAPLPSFHGGQHLTLRLPATDGATVVRCYSLSSAQHEGGYRISVKLARKAAGANGLASGAVHQLATGSTLELQAPAGRFHLHDDDAARPLVLVAAGIGITPLLAMLHQCRAQSPDRRIALLYGVRSGADHAFRDEISALSTQLSRLSVRSFYSAPRTADRIGADFDHQGRITADYVLLAGGPDAIVYLCGPGPMVGELRAGLLAAGVAPTQIYTEAFGPSSAAAAPSVSAQPIRLSRSGKTLAWDPQAGSLLDQLDRAGVVAASGCRAGQCESCILPVLEGKVAHPDSCAPVADDRCLPCVCLPLSPLVLDI